MKRQRWFSGILILLILFSLQAAAEEDPEVEIQLDVPQHSVTHMDGHTLVVENGVTIIGQTEDYIYDPDIDDTREVRAELFPGDIQLYTLYVDNASMSFLPSVKLPDSLRVLGPEAITGGSIAQLRLPGSIRQISAEAFYSIYVDEMILAADYTGPIPDGTYMGVGAWRVEEGNPLYSAKDGILFSADGKSLLRYPQGKTASYYEVPAGTEAIGRDAFSNDMMACPLLAVSLPIGLRRIEGYAFSGCGLLRSVTVPLTVTELDPTAFANCVSLERLSLPPGFSVVLGSGAEETDFTYYTGDNGSTMASPKREPSSWRGNPYFQTFRVMLDTPDGTGTVPLYMDDHSDRIVEEKPVRTTAWVRDIRNGRADLTERGAPRWVNLKNIRYIHDNYFFVVEDAEILKPEIYNPDNRAYAFQYCLLDDALFEEAETEEELEVPLEDVRLFREDTGDGAVYGFAARQNPPVQILDQPEGSPVAHLYIEDQARVTDRRDGWLKVETAYGDGWLPENALIIVEPMKAKQ